MPVRRRNVVGAVGSPVRAVHDRVATPPGDEPAVHRKGDEPGDAQATWLAARTDRAAGLTVREAVKYLPAAEAQRLVAAQRARRRLA